jgi:glycerol uptake facilitator-like aquaporin
MPLKHIAIVKISAMLMIPQETSSCNVVLTGTKGNNSGWIVITTGWAFAVFIGVVVAGPVSGAHLNPSTWISTCR